MPNKVGIRINKADLKHLIGKIDELENISKTDLKRSLNHIGKNTVGRMKRDAPVDTGRLRREVTYRVPSNRDIVLESKAIDPKTGVDYAPAQEYGLHGLRPQPYFRHNARLGFRRLYEDLKRRIKLIINK